MAFYYIIHNYRLIIAAGNVMEWGIEEAGFRSFSIPIIWFKLVLKP